MSRRYPNALFFTALCSSYVALCGTGFAADSTDAKAKNTSEKATSKPAKAAAVATEDTDSWRGKSVFARSREEYKAKSPRLGGFELKPTLTLQEAYDSNIYATQTAEEEDFITKITPAIALESDWSNHALNFNASGDFGLFSDNSRENFSDYTVGTSGRLDILKETYLLGSASSAHLHEDRGSPDANATTKNPTEYTQNDASVGIIRRLRKFSVKLDGGYTGFDYENGETGAGATVINNNRDRDQYKATARLGYEIIPEYEAFIRGSMNERDYDLAVNQGGVNRDSDGYEVVVGTAINLGGKTKGEVFAGYMGQDYESAALKDAKGAQFGGDILWNATGLTSVKAGIIRDIAETTTAGASSYISTSYSLGLEHEITYNVLAGVNVSYALNDYETNSTAAREDKLSGAGAELRYLLNRNASVVGRYDYTNRDSNVVNQDYDRSILSLGLKLAM